MSGPPVSGRAAKGTAKRAVSAAAAVALAAGGLAALGPGAGYSSSHREAPFIAGQPLLDNTDTYAFVSPDKPDTVTMLAAWIPFEESNGGPNFYPWAENTAYDINIDNDGDAVADIIYRWWFQGEFKNPNTFLYNTNVVTSLDDPDLNFRETYTLQRIENGKIETVLDKAPVAPSFVGKASMPNYEALSNSAIKTYKGGKYASFAGQAEDPFFLDLRIFDLLYGADLSEVGNDTVRGYNVNYVALQVPKNDLALRGNAERNPVVGIWSTTSRQIIPGLSQRFNFLNLKQESRLGMPLVNEVVIPVGKKDEFNRSRPHEDGKFLNFVTKPEVPGLVEALYKIPAPAQPRNDLVEVFLTGVCKACPPGTDPKTRPLDVDLNSQLLNKDVNPAKFRPSEQLRLNMSVPPSANPERLGVLKGDIAGFPNGRRLADDVLDITLQAAEGVLLPGHPVAVEGLGDGVDTNDVPFRNKFPYMALPNTKAVNQSTK
jgi:hypothetical protein